MTRIIPCKEFIAYHEAGHAVVACHTGIMRVKDIVVLDEIPRCRYRYSSLIQRFRFCILKSMNLNEAENFIKLLVAGQISDKHNLERRRNEEDDLRNHQDGDYDDQQKIINLVEKKNISKTRLNYLFKLSEDTVLGNWKTVEMIARAWLDSKSGKLRGEKIYSIYCQYSDAE